MNETVLFGLLALSFVLPALIGYILWQYDGMPAWLIALVVAIGVMAVAIVQYTWAQNHTKDFLGMWVWYVVVALAGKIVTD